MGCPKLTERDYFRLEKRTEKTAISRFFHTVSYDPIGNRTHFSSVTSVSPVTPVTNSNTTLLAYNSLNQLQTASPAKMGMSSLLAGNYQYDAFGNLTNTPKASYKYNLNNRLIEVKQGDKKLTFAYDGNGRRTEKKVYKKSSTGDWKLITDHRFLYSEIGRAHV